MAYSLVSIYENGKMVDGVVPTNWIIERKVYWSNSAFAEREAENRLPVNLNWPSFALEKVRFSHDDKRECEEYHWSSSNECEKETSEPIAVSIPVLPIPPKMQIASSTSLLRKSPQKTPQNSPLATLSSTLRHAQNEVLSDKSFPFPSLTESPHTLTGGSSELPRDNPSPLSSSSLRRSPRKALSLLTESPVEGTSTSLRKSPRKQPSKAFASFSSALENFPKKRSAQKSSQAIIKTKKSFVDTSSVSDNFSSQSFSSLRRSPRKKRSRNEEESNTSDSASNEIEISQPSKKLKKKKRNGAEYNKSRYPLSDADFQRKIINLLLEIRELLHQRGPANDATIDDLENIQKCRSVDELIELDEELDEEEKFQAFVKSLARVGGKNFSNNVKNVLLTVASDEVWCEFSFAGFKRKRKFKDSRTCSAITNALLRCTRVSKSEIEKTIARIIKHAPERVK